MLLRLRRRQRRSRSKVGKVDSGAVGRRQAAAGRPARLGQRQDAAAPEQMVKELNRVARARASRSTAARPPSRSTVVVKRGDELKTFTLTPRYDAETKRMRVGLAFGTDHGRRSRSARPSPTPATAIWHVTEADGHAAARDLRRREAQSRSPASSAATRSTQQAIDSNSTETTIGIIALISLQPRAHQPLPVPAARRRPHLLGAGREGARQADPDPGAGAREHGRLRAGRDALRRSASRTTSSASATAASRPLSGPRGRPRTLSLMASKRQIYVGSVPIGGGAPVAVQTMTKTETANLAGDDGADPHASPRPAPTSSACAVPRDEGRRGAEDDRRASRRSRSSPTSTSTTRWR